jgi:PadR family transcriptional regulator, regulatory protein PadR
MRAEVLKGHVDLLLLAVLADEPTYGYRIVELLRERSAGVLDLAEGTVYPALYRLERQGVVTSSWSTVEGRRRRVYRLTRAGVKELAERRRAWTDFAGAVRAVLS